MASSFCPKCGTPRVGGFRFCSSCKLDFDEIDRAAATGATTQIPASNAPPPPQSYSEKYAGTQWAAPLAPTTTAEPGDRRSPGGMLTIAGLAGLAVVAGLVVVLVAGGLGKGPTAPAASPALALETVSPTAAPTPDQMAAASRFREIESAYVEAYTARHDKLPASGYFASYAQARDYYRNEVKNLELFGSRVEAMTFPTEVMPDVRVLLERVSELAALMDKLAATKGETTGWKVNEKIMTARTAMNAARVVVGKGLGLSYDADLALTPTPTPTRTPKPTAKPTARPTPKPTSASGWTAAAKRTAAAYRVSVSQTYEVELASAVAGLRSLGICTTGEECYYAGQQQRTYIRIASDALSDHLAFMKANAAARCFRDAYAKDRSMANWWLEFLPTWSVTSSGSMRYFMQMLSIYASETDEFLATLDGYFKDCK